PDVRREPLEPRAAACAPDSAPQRRAVGGGLGGCGRRRGAPRRCGTGSDAGRRRGCAARAPRRSRRRHGPRARPDRGRGIRRRCLAGANARLELELAFDGRRADRSRRRAERAGARRSALARSVAACAGDRRDARRVGALAPGAPMRTRVGLGTSLLVLALLAAVAALVEPSFRHEPTRTLIAVDHSASIDAAMQATEERWVSAAVADGACPRPCAVVEVAGDPSTAPAGAAATEAPVDATDLARGVEAAVAEAHAGDRVLVVSDGEEAAASANAVADAAARGVTIDGVLLHDPARRDAAVTRLDAPSAVHQGDTVSLLVTVRST